MIVIVSSSAAERTAFAALCDSRGWANIECDSVRAAKKSFQQLRPLAVLTRHKLRDGYSDDLMITLAATDALPAVKVIVLLESGAASALAARQIALGAESVQRDPVRTEVLLEYLARYRQVKAVTAQQRRREGRQPFRLAGATIRPVERRLAHGTHLINLTPREVQLAELLYASPGEVVTYESLYSEILGSKFRGETSNMRVLLGKLDASFRSAGLTFRAFVEVIPKTGYRYHPPRPLRSTPTPVKVRAPVTSK